MLRRKDRYSYKYINGNYLVSFDGNTLTKQAFRIGEDLISNFPDSIDLKISNKCARNCPFCHENSVINGEVLDVKKTIERLNQLPEKPIEFAIGGGNILESISETTEITDYLLSRGHRVRCTVRYEDITSLTEDQREVLKKFEGIGISISHLTDKLIEVLNTKDRYSWWFDEFESNINNYFKETLYNTTDKKELSTLETPKFVIHIIAGLFPIDQLELLIEKSNVPVLVLGYKQWGRAANTPLPKELEETEKIIKQSLYKSRYKEDIRYKNSRLVFDNLALEQLHIKDSLTKEEWENLYMGDEGTHSMYIDAVAGEYARTSRSPERISWDDVGLIEYFKSLRK